MGGLNIITSFIIFYLKQVQVLFNNRHFKIKFNDSERRKKNNVIWLYWLIIKIKTN
jgi:hypothetical protein